MSPMPGFMRRPWPWAVAVLLVAGYAAAGFWMVPRLITSGVHDFVATHYHREAHLGAVTFNPFTLELEARSFAVPDADGGPLVSFERLYVKLGLISIVRGGLDFQAIDLTGPKVRLVRRPDGRVNLLDLALPPQAKPEPTPNPNAPPPRLWITELAVRGGEATVVDLKRQTPLTLALQPIAFTLRNFSTRSEGNAYALSALSTRGEGLDWRGSFGLAPITSQGTFALSHIKAQTLTDIAAGRIPFDLSGGELDIKGSYEVAENGESLALNAKVAELVLTALGIRARGEATDAVAIPRLTVTGTTIDLGAQTIAVGQVAVEQPRVTAVRTRDGQLSLTRLVPGSGPPTPPAAAAAPGPTAAPAARESTPWTITVPDIRIAGADLSLEDHGPTRPVMLHVAPLDLTVHGFASPARGALAVDLQATVNGDGRVAVKGDLTPSPLAGHLTIEAGTLPLTALQPYLDDATGMVIKSGTAGLKGAVSLGAGGAVDFDGEASVDGLRTIDAALEEDFIKWRSLRLAGLRVRTAPLSVKIREIVASEPYARVIIGSNGITNLKVVLAPHTAEAAAAPATDAASGKPAPAAPAASAPLPVDIGIVRVADGSVNFADFSIKPNFVTGIQQLAGTIKGLSARPDARAEVKLEGAVDRYAPVTITGTVNYFAAVSYTNLHVSFKNLELTSLSPYSGKFAGYRIDKGKLSADFSYLVENRKLNATHKIVIDQLQLGERVESSDATSLPVKLAIALLKDRNGVIDLDLPVTGSLDDPQFRLGPLIWKVVVNLITKIATSPFKLLGSLFGGGEEISFVDFAPGSATLDAAAKAKLQTLAKALDSRPALSVDVPMIAQPEADRAALAELRWREDLTARASHRLGTHATDPGAIDHLLATPKDYRALLEDAYRESFGHRAEIPKPEAPAPTATPAPAADPQAQAIAWLETALKGRISVAPADLDALAKDRASAVQVALLDGTGIDPTRVFVITAPPLPPASPLRMQLALH
ncbi:MAG TPA: DUF748 domain-containing protein [Steroidobacteraceae bacterium]|nr:DUF748 domain-containing protein [Steroidobacteraceae bacterium]